MSRLHTIKLANNQLNGPLPDFLGELRLVHVGLQVNQFTGEVPSSLGKLSLLEELHLQLTNLVGTMPEEVCALVGADKELQVLTADCQKIECPCCTGCS